MEKLVAELAAKLVKLLGLIDVSPEDITPKTPFFDGGLGLDSIDMLEMVFLLDRDYGVLIDSRELGEKVLIDFGTLARYIAANRQITDEGRSE